jgi:FkbM family methyltransferase
MELFFNSKPSLTEWIIKEGMLQTPFVLLDVGVQGGIHPRWEALGDQLQVFGFDPLEEAIAPLEAERRRGRQYFAMALGNEDGERGLFIQENRCATSFYAQAPSRFDVSEATWRSTGVRRVKISRLDSLYNRGIITRADFIKLDCEGFEPEVFKGGGRFLGESGLLGADLESNFNVSPMLPDTHFWASYEPLLRRGLILFDLNFNRVPRASYVRRLADMRDGVALPAVHRPATCNLLFARDLIQERDSPDSFPSLARRPATADELLKSMIIFELYGLIDWAFDLLVEFKNVLVSRIDIEHAAGLLVPARGGGVATKKLFVLRGLRGRARRAWRRAWQRK